MSEGNSGGRRRIPLVALIVVALLAGVLTGLTAAGALPSPWFGSAQPEQGALDVEPPEDLPSPQAREARPVLPAADGEPGAARAAGKVAPLLRDPSLRKHVGVAVADLATGEPSWDNLGADLTEERFTPASTLKLFTTVAALTVLDPGHRFATSVVRIGGGTPRLVLVGGGDPLLARGADPALGGVDSPARPASLRRLAAETSRALRRDGVRRVRLAYDDGLFTGPAVSPSWERLYVADDVVSPISSLWVDEGRLPGSEQRSADPARDAADEFRSALERKGVRVSGAVAPGSGDAGDPVAEVQSAPLDQLVAHILTLSDNEAAEVLLRHVGLATERPGSFAGGAAGVRATLEDLGVAMTGVVLRDGSGLARSNKVTLPAVLGVLSQAAAGDDRLRSAVTGLPVAGFNGTASYRFVVAGARAARGFVRAKTGTLTGVHGLAGTLVDRDGAALAFVALTDQVPTRLTLDARDQLDRVVAALAECGC